MMEVYAVGGLGRGQGEGEGPEDAKAVNAESFVNCDYEDEGIGGKAAMGIAIDGDSLIQQGKCCRKLLLILLYKKAVGNFHRTNI